MYDFMDYLEYLEANNLMLDEYGNEVEKNKEKTLSLELEFNSDDED